MSLSLDMAEQIQPISYEEALVMYNLGFSIEVEIKTGESRKNVILEENSADELDFEARLVDMKVLSEELKPIAKADFFAQTSLMKRCGMHIAYSDSRTTHIEYDTCPEIIRKMVKVALEYPSAEKYIRNNTAYIEIK